MLTAMRRKQHNSTNLLSGELYFLFSRKNVNKFFFRLHFSTSMSVLILVGKCIFSRSNRKTNSEKGKHFYLFLAKSCSFFCNFTNCFDWFRRVLINVFIFSLITSSTNTIRICTRKEKANQNNLFNLIIINSVKMSVYLCVKLHVSFFESWSRMSLIKKWH